MALFLVGTKCCIGYDDYDGFVVRAPNAEAARLAAQVQCGSHTNSNDFSEENAVIEKLKSDGPTEIVLYSFNAG